MAELIIEDLSESPPPSKGPPPWWAGVAVGVAIGLAAAFLLGVGDDAGQPATTTVPAAGTSSTVPQVTSDTLHPDFQQGLSAIVESDVQGLDWIDWPPADIPLPVSVERLPFGDLGVTVLPTLDPSGHFVAVEVPMNDSPAGVLYAGPVTNVDTVATDVTGHAWHDSVTGFLAFTTEKDGEVGLWTTPLGGVQNVTNAIGFSGAHVVGFGNWGWALQDADGETVHIFNEFGELLRSEPGEFLDSHSSGHLLLLDEGAVVEVDPAGRRREVRLGAEVQDVLAVLDGVGDLWGAIFAPDPGRYALIGNRGMALIEGESTTIYPQDPSRHHIVAGGDYVMYPQRAGVVVVDLTTGDDFVILQDENVRTVAFSPAR
ncbi:MAG: hypothetical protein IH943_10865 [Acidobacteria bacterium]|nr:hypothetical protein [Acidobacteriota bacterium]